MVTSIKKGLPHVNNYFAYISCIYIYIYIYLINFFWLNLKITKDGYIQIVT